MDIETQKITAHIPVNLLHNAQEATGKGITETVKAGLEMVARAKAYENLLKLRGKISFEGFDLDELRKDKDEE